MTTCIAPEEAVLGEHDTAAAFLQLLDRLLRSYTFEHYTMRAFFSAGGDSVAEAMAFFQ